MTGQERPEKWPTGACWCGAKGDNVHPYAGGLRCDEHAPWALAGQAHPSAGRYCLAVCYCSGCGTVQPPPPPVRDTVLDLDRIRKGRRRSSPEAYRAARDQPRRR